MGKGDKKSRRGKIILGTYGVRRRRKSADKPAIDPAIINSKEAKGKTAKDTGETPGVKEVRHTRVKEAKEEKAVKAASRATEPRPVRNKKVVDEEKAAEEKPAETKPLKAKKA
jgi:ribosomal small subunit protein bTHX